MRHGRWNWPFVLLALGATQLGCDSRKGDEARSLLAAVDRFMNAENDAEPAALPAIEATTCTSPDICEVRDACLAWARPSAQSRVLTRDVRVAFAQLEDAGAPTPADRAKLAAYSVQLQQAEASLKQGHDAFDSCNEKLRVLRTKYAR